MTATQHWPDLGYSSMDEAMAMMHVQFPFLRTLHWPACLPACLHVMLQKADQQFAIRLEGAHAYCNCGQLARQCSGHARCFSRVLRETSLTSFAGCPVWRSSLGWRRLLQTRPGRSPSTGAGTAAVAVACSHDAPCVSTLLCLACRSPCVATRTKQAPATNTQIRFLISPFTGGCTSWAPCLLCLALRSASE